LKKLADDPVTPRGGATDNKTEAHPEVTAETSEKSNSNELPITTKIQLDTGDKLEEKQLRRSSKNADGTDGAKSPRDKQKREKRQKDKSARDRRPSEPEENTNTSKSGNNSLEHLKTDNGSTAPDLTPRTAEEYSLLTQIYSAVAPSKASMAGNKRATIATTSPEKHNSKSDLKADHSSNTSTGSSERLLNETGGQSKLRE